MKKYLGLDYGEKTIGVSVSPNGNVAVGLTTLRRSQEDALRPNLKELKAIIREHGITNIVLGNPLHLSGRESERCIKTLAFKDKLNRYFKSIPVELWDERLSTQAVSRVFQAAPKNFNDKIDEMAAVYILQGFLDLANNKRRRKMENINLDPTPHGEESDDNTLVLHDDEGNEIALLVLAFKEQGSTTYFMAVDEEDDEVHLLKSFEEDNDVIFEIVDDEHEDFDQVFEMFKADFEEHGIAIEDIDLD